MSAPAWLADDPGQPAEITATLTRPSGAAWERLVRGQRVRVHGRQWRVTEAEADPDGGETYTLEPAEAVDARIEAAGPRP